MSAPASGHQAARRRVELVVEREYRPDPARCVAAIVKLLTSGPPDPRNDNGPSEDGPGSGA